MFLIYDESLPGVGISTTIDVFQGMRKYVTRNEQLKTLLSATTALLGNCLIILVETLLRRTDVFCFRSFICLNVSLGETNLIKFSGRIKYVRNP